MIRDTASESRCLTDLFLELHVPDFAPARRFYGALGFGVVREEDRYLVMQRGLTVINFYGGDEQVSEHSYFGRFAPETKRGYGVEIVIFVEDLAETFERAARAGKIVGEPQERPWGARDFRVEDPYGYYLRISEPYHATVGTDDAHTAGALVSPRRIDRFSAG